VRPSASGAAAIAACTCVVTSSIDSSAYTRAFGPAVISAAGVAALKPSRIRLRSGVEFSWIAP
jgi:hypothetical protein